MIEIKIQINIQFGQHKKQSNLYFYSIIFGRFSYQGIIQNFVSEEIIQDLKKNFMSLRKLILSKWVCYKIILSPKYTNS